MHLSFISTRGQQGLDAPPVTVEVHLSAGLPAFQVVGLGEGSSREIRSRVRAALISSHLKWPDFNITVTRAEHQHAYPARFQLVAAMNPCPCGLADSEDSSCRCSPDMIRRYRQGASGPLMDRIDLHVKLSRPSPEALLSAAPTEKSSAQLRERVTVTRERQLSRQGRLNRDLAGNDIVELCALSKTTRASLIEALTALNVSARSAHRRLRVARTLADMEGEERVSMSHINTALSFREAPTGVGAV